MREMWSDSALLGDRSMITVLAIDPSSTNAGWCYLGDSAPVIWSTQYRQELHAEKFGAMFRDVTDALGRFRPTTVAFELPSSFRSHPATKVCFGLAGVIHAASHFAGYPSVEVNNETIKAHAGVRQVKKARGGKMTAADKAEARKERLAELIRMARLFGFDVVNDDEAVACILADYVRRHAVIGAAVEKASRKRRVA